ncbi:MAG: CBS domain-containing protein [Syntrophobacteraceae bacterium]
MEKKTENRDIDLSRVGLTDADIYEAMKSISGYLDITPGDFKELYCIAYKHAAERFARSMTARDIMVAAVVSVSPEASLSEVVETMSQSRVSGAPVVDGDRKVLGIISEKDVLFQLIGETTDNFMTLLARCLRSKGCVAMPVRKLTAREVMTSPAITVREDATLVDIAASLTQKQINRLPVTDAAGRLVGIITRSDIVSATLRSGTCSWNI